MVYDVLVAAEDRFSADVGGNSEQIQKLECLKFEINTACTWNFELAEDFVQDLLPFSDHHQQLNIIIIIAT